MDPCPWGPSSILRLTPFSPSVWGRSSLALRVVHSLIELLGLLEHSFCYGSNGLFPPAFHHWLPPAGPPEQASSLSHTAAVLGCEGRSVSLQSPLFSGQFPAPQLTFDAWPQATAPCGPSSVRAWANGSLGDTSSPGAPVALPDFNVVMSCLRVAGPQVMLRLPLRSPDWAVGPKVPRGGSADQGPTIDFSSGQQCPTPSFPH